MDSETVPVANLSRLQRATRDLSALTVATFTGVVFAFLVQVLLVRALPTAEYGVLSTALAAITLASPIAGLGVGKYWLRVFGVEGWRAVRWVSPSIRLAGIGLILAISTIAVWSLFGQMDDRIGTVTLLLLPTVALYPLVEMMSARLQLEGRYGRLALWELTPNACRLLVALAAILIGLTVTQVAAALSLVIGALVILMAISVVGMVRGHVDLAGHGARSTEPDSPTPSIMDVLAGSWPFALSGVFYLIYFQSDVILLGWLDGPIAAGTYNVAFAVMAAVYLLPSVFHQKYLLPKMHRWAVHDPGRFLAAYRFGNGTTLALGVVVAILVYLIAPWAVRLVFGQEYASAGPILAVLSVAVPGRYLATSVGAVLVTQDNMRRKVWLMGAVAVVNLGLNVWLIPLYGPIGAAWATVASDVTLLALYLVAVHRHVFGTATFVGWTISPRKLR